MIITIKEHFLTTNDNPFDPFKSFDDWFSYDVNVLHHNTCSYLERQVHVNNPNIPTNKLKDDDWNQAMTDIVDLNPFLYKIVTKDVEIDDIYLLD